MTDFDNETEWTVNIDADTSALRRELDRTSLVGRQFSRSLVTAFEGIAIQGRSVGDVLRQLGLALSRMVLSAAFKPLDQAFNKILGSLLGGGLGFANGGVFQQGTPVPFAKGGVIATPIAFPMTGGRTGLAGERGAEAIMPLARGPDGRLGVVASGGSVPSITINIATPDVEGFRRSQTQVAAMVARSLGRADRNL